MLVLTLATSIAVAALAMWLEWYTSQPKLHYTPYPPAIAVTVTLARDGGHWAAVGIGDRSWPGRPEFAPIQSADGHQAFEHFYIDVESCGGPRIWREQWRIMQYGPMFMDGPPPDLSDRPARIAAARAELAKRIEAREFKWPRGLIVKDSCSIWRPWNQFLNGAERLGIIMAIPVVPVAGFVALSLLRRIDPRYCPCGYSLEGLRSSVCPECGRKTPDH